MLICPICDQPFAPDKHHRKYCSRACAIEAASDMQRMRDKHRRIMGDSYGDIDFSAFMERQRTAQSEKTQSADDARRQFEAQTEADASAGDLVAQMRLAMKAGDSVEYWRLRKQYFLQECKRLNIEPRADAFVVGGISVLDDDFEYIVGSI